MSGPTSRTSARVVPIPVTLDGTLIDDPEWRDADDDGVAEARFVMELGEMTLISDGTIETTAHTIDVVFQGKLGHDLYYDVEVEEDGIDVIVTGTLRRVRGEEGLMKVQLVATDVEFL